MKRVIGLIGCLGLAAGCGQPVDGKEKIKVGAIISLTGNYGALGSERLNGAVLAVEEINKAGGVLGKELELIARDDSTDPATARSIAESMVNSDGVPAIIGAAASGSTMAMTEVTIPGKVVSIWSTVQQRSWQDPVKIVRIDVDLDRTDTTRMRPGMRFQGKIETERVANALVVPIEAVFPKSGGPVAYRRGRLGWTVAPLELGRRNDKAVEVLRGLEAGDEVARRDLSLAEKDAG